MKNKILLKKYLKKIIFISLIILFVFIILSYIEYHIYTVNYNNKILQILSAIKEEYPNITENEIIEILNNDYEIEDTLTKYSIDINKDSIVINNTYNYYIFLIINIVFLILVITIIIFIFLKYEKKKDKEINDITEYLKEINKKNYILEIDTISEDELSILKNEIYKTTVMLKELADNSLTDKKILKNSIADISHQLKTPLTSILIMLDSLIDDENMDNKTRYDFIMDIKREVLNINFLVKSILTLSRFDVSSIKFTKHKVKVNYLINEAIKNMLSLCDLKNIDIKVSCNENDYLICDSNWQIEALTNIIKNSLEHSNNESIIEIKESQNNSYTLIEIKDYGLGIDKNDLPHIFERFYKGKNSSENSVGIGLALSKSIIEEDNGKIAVESCINDGTKFIIKYFHF